MSDAANAYELPADQTVPADVVNEAADGEVVYLTRDGRPVAAIVSADAAEYLEALEDAADIIATRRALAEKLRRSRPIRSGPSSGSTTPCDRQALRAPVPGGLGHR